MPAPNSENKEDTREGFVFRREGSSEQTADPACQYLAGVDSQEANVSRLKPRTNNPTPRLLPTAPRISNIRVSAREIIIIKRKIDK